MLLATFLAVLLALTVLGPYFYTFSGSLSSSSQEWSNFGSYVGGTLGPLYALLAFGAAIFGLFEARRQSAKQALLVAIQRHESEFEAACVRTVTCTAPWVWGNSPDETRNLDRVALSLTVLSRFLRG